ncbi:MAG: DUF58 domain-containing protein [Thermoanaerobaculales bacterium]|nr:DUF58 domain-containing protein [Thermoanaerobaculales bacterium]
MKNPWRLMFPVFRLRLTRWGGVFLILALVMAFAAVNTGNNGLMAVLGVVLGSYIVSGIWSRQVLGTVSATVHSPPEIFAGRPVRLEVKLMNGSRIFPAYGLVIRAEDGSILLAEPFLSPGESVRRTVSCSLDRRGWSDFGGWRLEVVLPLGFFVKSKEILKGRRVLVYPALVRGPVSQGAGKGTGKGIEKLSGRGRHGDVFQLRDFRDGDDRRQIHWKQTARQQRLITVDRRRQVVSPLVLRLDPTVSDLDDPEILGLFERRVSAIATAILDRLNRGESVVLEVGGVRYHPEHRRAGARRLLEPLATVEPRSGAEVRV